MWQIIFSNISVQDGVVHPNIHSFFDGSSYVVPLPVYNMEVFNCCFVATVILMFINWRWCLQIFFKSFYKCSRWLPSALIITVNPPTISLYMILFFFAMLFLSMYGTRIFLSVCPPLKCTTTPWLPHIFLRLSHMPCTYGTTIWYFLVGFLDGWVCFFFFTSFCSCCHWNILFMAHLG